MNTTQISQIIVDLAATMVAEIAVHPANFLSSRALERIEIATRSKAMVKAIIRYDMHAFSCFDSDYPNGGAGGDALPIVACEIIYIMELMSLS
ncbi:hypothetical protein [Rhizobium sp. YTU87027]|uniref:hypothetical protein n=1 Tax=Rhizobium sp. YTU87027 TaxID=3417741 RepID=UPI003D68EA5B